MADRTDSASPFLASGNRVTEEQIFHVYDAVARCAPPGLDPDILTDELHSTYRRLSGTDAIAVARSYGAIAAGLGQLRAALGPEALIAIAVEISKAAIPDAARPLPEREGGP